MERDKQRGEREKEREKKIEKADKNIIWVKLTLLIIWRPRCYDRGKLRYNFKMSQYSSQNLLSLDAILPNIVGCSSPIRNQS